MEGVPAGLPLDEDYIARDLRRRQGGYGRGGRMKIEQDWAEILSGVRHGFTIGSPISLLLWNRDWENWREIMAVSPVESEIEPVTRLRAGHADLAGALKYGHQDVRPVLERASARETAARVAVGAIARRLVAELGIQIHSHSLAIGGVWSNAKSLDWDRVESSPVRCTDPDAEEGMVKAIDRAKEAGDSVGGVVQVVATGVPVGLGSHVQWDRRLDGRVAQAVMSVNAVKGVEIGAGFSLAGMKGSDAHDIIQYDGETGRWSHQSNRAGGITGGIANGEPLVVNAVVKPVPTLAKPLPSADLRTGQEVEGHVERADVCVVPAAGVIAEAMVAVVLADATLEKFGGDHLAETLRNFQAYLDTIAGRHGH